MVYWLYGLCGSMVMWFNGYMVYWLYGLMVIWLNGYMVYWLYGLLVIWFMWFSGYLVLSGVMVVWFLVQSFKETLQYCDEWRKFTSVIQSFSQSFIV